MKAAFAILLVSLTAPAFAGDKPFCADPAADAVLGLVKGLGQDVAIENVIWANSRYEKNGATTDTFEIKLKGNGFTSRETNGIWIVKLNDLGSGCGFESIALKD